MEIRKWMKHPVHVVKPLDTIQHVRDLMDKHRVKQLPVAIAGRLVGIVTDRDLRDAFPSVFDSPAFGRRMARTPGTDPRTLPVEMVMTPNVTTVAPGDSMIEAARLVRRNNIGALPVVEGDKLAGILTRSDIIDSFIDLAELADQRETSSFSGTAAPQDAGLQPAKAATRKPRQRRGPV
jgi:acetoin utilization protein AcuB